MILKSVLKLVSSKPYTVHMASNITVDPPVTMAVANFFTCFVSTSALPFLSFAVGSAGSMLKVKIDTSIVVKRLIPVLNTPCFFFWLAE